MLFRPLAGLRSIALPDGPHNSPMLKHRSGRFGAEPDCEHASPVRLVHDGVEHARQPLIPTLLDQKLMEAPVCTRPSHQIVCLERGFHLRVHTLQFRRNRQPLVLRLLGQ